MREGRNTLWPICEKRFHFPRPSALLQDLYAKAGVPESVIMEITGHSTREMFDRYNTIDHDDRRKAVDQMSYFLKTFENKPSDTKEKG